MTADAPWPRSWTNRNPGNLRRAPRQVGTDTRPGGPFAVFASQAEGWRALAELLLFYGDTLGLRTVGTILPRYAPATENNTGGYVASVCKAIGCGPEQVLDLRAAGVLLPLCNAIATVEAGRVLPWDAAQQVEGLRLAGIRPKAGAAVPPVARPDAAKPEKATGEVAVIVPDGLLPRFAELVGAVLRDCRAAGVVMIPCYGLRTPLAQARLWRQGRTGGAIATRIAELRKQGAGYTAGVLEAAGPQGGPRVTNALPGESWHNWGEAVDCYVLGRDGKPDWDGAHPGYRTYAAAAQARELHSLLAIGDAGHIQLRETEPPALYGSAAALDRALRARWPMPDGQAGPGGAGAAGSSAEQHRAATSSLVPGE